ncbi:MAG: class I SAM-dependent methyltransferase [Chlorobiaceae bacterium]|nr:class I SAM-dependent methyltransferase [Chlorobiaceae bacterium]
MSFYSRFAACYEQVFPFREEVYRFLLGHAGPADGSVLDVGCGPGHYCGRFARDGYRATGLDLDEAMVVEAGRHYPEAEFLCLDMRSAKTAGRGFRCIYSIGNVLAHLHREDLAPFIDSVHGMLVPGGCWIMQVMNWDALMTVRDYRFPDKTLKADGVPAVFQRRYSNIGRDSLTFSFSLNRTSGAEIFSERFTLYPVSGQEYVELHDAAGFRRSGVYADFSESPVRSDPGSGLVMAFVRD